MPEDFFEGLAVSAATFLIEVDGQEIGRFEEAGGLQVDVSVEDLEEGGENGFVRKLPGRMTWPNLTLKRGITRSDNLFKWLGKSSGQGFSGEGNKLTRSTAAITLIGPGGSRLRTWEFDEAFPVRWKGPQFATSATAAADEELEIAHHGFRARSGG